MAAMDVSLNESDPSSLGDQLLWTILDTSLLVEDKIRELKTLISLGADINHDSHTGVELSGMFPLLLATAIGNNQIVQLLLENGADVNQVVGEDLYRQSAVPTALHQACLDGHTDIVELLTAHKGLKCLEARDYSGKTPFHCAIESGDVDIVRHLIQCGCDFRILDKDGSNGLFVAASLTGAKLRLMFSYLLIEGLCPFQQNNKGLTPLKYAALLGKTEAVELVSEIHVDKCSLPNLDTSSIGLSELETLVIFKKWKGLQLNHLRNIAEKCLAIKTDKSIHFAVQYGDCNLVDFLLCCGGRTKVNSYTAFGMTPLLMACDSKSIDLVQVLLKHGAEANQTSNFDRSLSPLKKAVLNGEIETTITLLQHGADTQNGANKHLINRALYSRDVATWTVLIAGGSMAGAISQYLLPVSYDMAENMSLIHCLYAAGHYHTLSKFAKSLPCDQEGVFNSQPVPQNFNRNLRNEIFLLMSKPQYLQDLCKNVIRKRLGGRVLQKSKELGLPVSIKRFIELYI